MDRKKFKLVRESIDIYGPGYTTDITWEEEDKNGNEIPISSADQLRKLNPRIEGGKMVDNTTDKISWSKPIDGYTQDGYPYKKGSRWSSRGKTFPRGYKTMKVLEFIDQNHPTFMSIIEYAYELTYGGGTFDRKYNRGYWSDKFNERSGGVTNFHDLCYKAGAEYFLNDKGYKAIKDIKNQLEKFKK
jgi:hypothetical protein